jgi:hypothetical protein
VPNGSVSTNLLRRNHGATRCQGRLPFPHVDSLSKQRSGPTKRTVLLTLLLDARVVGRVVQLPEIMALGMAQHGALFNELRSLGFEIRNEIERSADGRVLSRYSLAHDPERDPPTETTAAPESGAIPRPEAFR